jgi:hypothetical protein
MLKCKKCKGRMFVDRLYSSRLHLELYCMSCGVRQFMNPPQSVIGGSWLLEKEILRAKHTISPL